jgi:NAD(P)-dependent dehydrogenase (short-subunit alcohol dehydrogenase family)
MAGTQGTGTVPGRSAEGRVALVTGGAVGIGRAVCAALVAEGYRVTAADISPRVDRAADSPLFRGIVCDVTKAGDMERAVEAASEGGRLDLLVCNAGIFTAGKNIADLDDATWERGLAVNLTGTFRVMRAAIPALKQAALPGAGGGPSEQGAPSIIVIGSRNALAPGPGAASYSVTKAGITQLARVAALELAADGVRVNVIHPDAVFDTELWTPEALARSAERYGLTVEEYKRKNLMKTEVRSADVAAMVCAMAGPAFARTTGAQVTVDGGNDRVI